MRAGRFGLALSCALLFALTATTAAASAACTVRKNIEAIIDDSGSMSITDSNRLRVSGVDLLMKTPGNSGKTLGAIEFGSDADVVFAPGPIGSNRTAFEQALDQKIQADNGSTDYNAAFALAKTANPNADRRIFLTDGEHNAGDYANGHQGGPPTDTIGLGSGISSEGEARLKQIASDTGGIYRKANDDSEIQAAMGDVNAKINCSTTPVRVTDTFAKTGSVKKHSLTIGSGIHSVTFTLSWVSSLDQFSIDRFRIKRGHKLVGFAKARRLKVTKTNGKTFVTVKLSKLVRGKLTYRLKAKKIGSSGFAGVKLITQASRSRKH